MRISRCWRDPRFSISNAAPLSITRQRHRRSTLALRAAYQSACMALAARAYHARACAYHRRSRIAHRAARMLAPHIATWRLRCAHGVNRKCQHQ